MAYVRHLLASIAIILVTPSLAFAQYITTQQQREQAQKNLQDHRQLQKQQKTNENFTVHTTGEGHGGVPTSGGFPPGGVSGSTGKP